MINIPDQTIKQWSQANQSDLFGTVHITKNITFDTEGYLRLSYSPREAMDETVDADFDNPAVILFSDDYGYFIETWDLAFSADEEVLSAYPTQIATAGVPSGDVQSDAVWFGGLMPVTQDTDVDYYDPAANTWTDTNISLTNNGQHAAVNFLSLSALAIADVNTVKLYQTPLTATPTLITTLTINSDFEITGMCYFNQNLYIATQNVYGGHAFLYVWNGLGTAANAVYEVDSNMIFSICAYKTYVMLLTGNGSLLKFNGGGLELAAAFPIFYTDQALTDEVNIGMYKNVMKSNGNLLYILFTNQENDNNRLLSMPDGVWCYDENVGLYHRYSPSNSLVSIQTTSTVNTTTNEITVTTAPVTGTEVVFTQTFGLTPLVDGTKYYVIKVSATVIKLATTYANAIAGTAIDLLVSSGNNTYTFFPNTDFGQYYTNRAFSLNVIERPVTNRIYGTDVMWGVGVDSRQLGSLETLGVPSDGVGARGYFITPKVFSTDVTDTQNLVTLKFSPFVSELDKIIIKYRTYDDMREYVNLTGWGITWTSSTTFTSTQADWSEAKTAFDAGEKWEVEVLQGAAGGLLAHITAITEAGGTYTVTIDETFADYAAGDVSKAVFRNWLKWKTVAYGDSNAGKYFISEQLGTVGKFIQLKTELRGVRTRIEEILIDNKYRLPKQLKAKQ